MEHLITQLNDLTAHLAEINNAGITIVDVTKQLFKDNNADMPLQLIADIKDFESKNDFEGIGTVLEQYISFLP
jgi:hypothetical protein